MKDIMSSFKELESVALSQLKDKEKLRNRVEELEAENKRLKEECERQKEFAFSLLRCF